MSVTDGLFLANTWALRYHGHPSSPPYGTPDTSRIWTYTEGSTSKTAVSYGTAINISGTTRYAAEVQSGDQYGGDPTYKDRAEVTAIRYLEYGETFTFEFGFNPLNTTSLASSALVVFQIHQSSDEETAEYSPPLELRLTSSGALRMYYRDASNQNRYEHIINVSPNEDVWHNIKIEVKFQPAARSC